MGKMYLSILVIFTVFVSSFSTCSCFKLPYEVQETLLDLLPVDELKRINTADRHFVRPIYRKDLEPVFVAYYEFNDGKSFRVLSAGPETEDKREVESGPLPTPTQVLIQQAERVGQQCKKFYRLAMGLYMCEDRRGIAVAATFDWVADAPVKDWRNLHRMVQNSLTNFRIDLKKTAESLKHEWSTSQRLQSNEDPWRERYDAELLSPGSTALVALEDGYTNITVHAVQKKRQHQLCQVLVNVCKSGKMTVNSELIHTLKNGISFIKLEIQEDKHLVQKVLRNEEIPFYVKIDTRKGEQILKYFSVHLISHRHRRWSQWSEWSITREDLFPDYNQHKCCGCMSGCGPVAWAQILAYYDRLARYSPSSGYSNKFWECTDGYANNCTAPKSMNSDVQRYIEGVRSKLGTFCLLGGGATTPAKMKKISNWYSARGIRGRILSKYSFLSIIGITNRSFKKTAASWVKEDYPVVVGLWTKSLAMHYAVATRYKERQKEYSRCVFSRCRTETKYDSSFYLHMGWGGTNNGWYSLKTFAVFSAKKY